MQTATKVCVVMAADANTLDVNRLKIFHDTIARHFPNLDTLDLFAVIYEDNTVGMEEVSVARGCIHVNHLMRSRLEYDIAGKVHEFMWLDSIGLTKMFTAERSKSKVARKKSTWERLHYKIYRHTHKWLERRGLLKTDYDM